MLVFLDIFVSICFYVCFFILFKSVGEFFSIWRSCHPRVLCLEPAVRDRAKMKKALDNIEKDLKTMQANLDLVRSMWVETN